MLCLVCLICTTLTFKNNGGFVNIICWLVSFRDAGLLILLPDGLFPSFLVFMLSYTNSL